MPALSTIEYNHPIVKFADTLAGLTTGVEYQCQAQAAALTPTPNYTDIKRTGCTAPFQKYVDSSWTLDLTFYQDWDVASGLSAYSYTNRGQTKFFSIALDSVGAPTVVATGEVTLEATPFGGTFGESLEATGSWKCIGEPDIVLPTATAADAASSGELADASA